MQVLLLDRNENQYGPSPACYQVLRSANLDQMSLYSRSFKRGTKGELAERLALETGVPEERILLSYGSEDMLKQVVHCFLHEGESILLPDKSWWYYKSLASEVSGISVTYTLREQDDRFVYDVDEMIALYDAHRPKVILIASPSNPTGNSLSADGLRTILAHCTSSVIALDEAYHGFAEPTQGSLQELLTRHGRLVVLRTFSKYFALAGLRIGYACVGADLAQLVKFTARYLGYNQLTERIALAALDSREYYARIAQQIKKDNELYFELFRSLPGFKPFRTEANFILVRYPVQVKREIQAGLASRAVVVKFLDDPGLGDCMRITTGTRDQNARVRESFREMALELAGHVVGASGGGS